MTKHDTFQTVAGMIREVLGDDWDPNLTIRRETSFSSVPREPERAK